MSTIANLTIEQKTTMLEQLYKATSNTDADKVRLNALMHDQSHNAKASYGDASAYVSICEIPNSDDVMVCFRMNWYLLDFETNSNGEIENFILVDGKRINVEY
ncbi:hypothetical protein MA9V1_127 [Chryseobacterium phage MA9V-1]|nr:hypothetical protein MA9V1_127 [Chryseobacterium phage MA9V-1]